MKKSNFHYLLFLTLNFTFLPCSVTGNPNDRDIKFQEMNFDIKRQQMVTNQIEYRGITDEHILGTFRQVKRHLFVPPEYQHLAYEDRPLPIGEGQTISQPYIVAFMTNVLQLTKNDKVLEIGTGSGYQAAILGELCESVYTIEIVSSLGEKARDLLSELGYDNVHVKIGDGYQGWLEHAPFDAIIVTCSPTQIPPALEDQLKEGGRMIIPVGYPENQKLVFLRKIDGNLLQQSVLAVRFVPMLDARGSTY